MNRLYKQTASAILIALATFLGSVAQGITRIPTFDRMIVRGQVETLRDTLNRITDTKISGRTQLYYKARVELSAGRTHEADSLLKSLKRNETSRPEALLVKGLSSAVVFDFERAEEAFAKLSKVRVNKDTTFLADIARSKRLLSTLDRMSQNMKSVKVVARQTLEVSKIDEELARQVAHLGKISRNSYITRDARQRWHVADNGAGGTTFAVGYRLGDGSWEEGDRIKIKGLSPQGEVTYPYLLADGSTVYFAYKGPETLGGWDVYVSRYDRNAKELLVPQQLQMPFNSLADDIMYILDEERGLIYLLTDRAGKSDEVELIAIEKSDSGVFDSEDPKALHTLAMLRHQAIDGLATMETFRHEAKTPTPTSETKVAILIIGTRKIYGERDLRKSSSKPLFRSYEEMYRTIEKDTQRLQELRQRWAKAKGADERERIGADILSTEAMLSDKHTRLRSMANEIIISEER
ncbi:hypothetical protein [Porphyromonas sp.]|uniref:hypothetical protein n=1 Tax=Porphyromonas sp. TaxID=1924944 RepID=UPI0026DD5907|nr:hypothetical protein [Porphyromonas sp.]MDO4771463.1 hypothetical protein [Porphyromonas sp.]